MEVNGRAGRVAPPPCVETEVNAGREGGVASPPCVKMEVNGGEGKSPHLKQR